jgi:transposase
MSEGIMVWRRGQTYSQDLRERVLAADDLSARAAAERFAVSVSYVIKARQRRSRAGAVTPRPQKPPVARKLVHLHEALRARVEQVPDATLAEHREWLFETHAVTAGLTTIWKTLVQLKLTLKKVDPGGRATARRRRGRARPLAGAAIETGRHQADLPR